MSLSGNSRGFRHAAVFLLAMALFVPAPAHAAGALSVEIINGYNLVVDSNVTSPSTYGPGSAFIGARVCNTGDAPLSNVFLNTGNYNGGVGSTPGVFPVLDSTGYVASPQITNTGSYSLALDATNTGAAEGSRYIGTLAAGQCRVEYWLITYPHCVNVNGEYDAPPCAASITGDVKPDDDVSLDYDVWATTTTPIATPVVAASRDFTMRNEISASANKIWPNTTSKVPDSYLAAIQSLIGWGTLGPDGQPLSDSNPVYPGQRLITTQGIWYDLGNVGQGFDNDGDLVPDQNAWLQPVGDPGAWDSDCFRMVNVYGILIVKLKTGGELLIPFQNELYFEGLPDNTGVVGLVYYQFIATDQGCSAAMTPYQEAASGFDNEKFSADFGLGSPLQSGTFGVNLPFAKTDGVASTTTGSTLTYTASGTNSTGVPLGAPDYGVPLIIADSIPAGTTFVAGSADDSPATNLSEPTGTGSYTQDYTDSDGNVDSCTINYDITSSQWSVFYSTNGGSIWTVTEPAPASVTDIRWLLETTMALDGGHDGDACLANDGLYDNGTLSTSLPPGKSVAVSFQVTVDSNGGPVVCNTAGLRFGGSATSTNAQDCTIVTGNNSISGNVFQDTGAGGGIFGNGTQDGTEAGIGAGVDVTLYYDLDGDGVAGPGDVVYTSTTTSAAGAYSFSNLADGPYLVVIRKYDGATSDGINNAATDDAFGTTGYGNTTADPNLPLTTNQGILKLNEDLTTTTLAVNIDLARADADGESLTNVSFGFAPPFRLTKLVALNPDTNADGRADTAIDEGDEFTYTITLENRLPSAGVQGPTGCQYTVWAPTGVNGNPANKEFTNYLNAVDGPNRNVASVLVTGGGLNFMYGTGFSLADQAGNITKVEALTLGYFGSVLTDDNLTNRLRFGGNSSSTTFSTALIDSYVGEPAILGPDGAITWDVTAARPGGGTWTWVDDFSLVQLEVNPSKASSADQKYFYLDALGLRITTDQDCEAGESTTLSPVPLQDSYDTGSVAFVSSVPPPDSINTGTGVIQWNDVGPILPGSTTTVNVTMRALNMTGTRTGTCGGSSPPTLNSACNWAETAWGGNHVMYTDGRQANDDDGNIAVTIVGKGEIRGTVWQDTNVDGWPNNDGEPGLPNVSVTLFGCVEPNGTMETGSTNKTCTGEGNTWNVIATTTTTASGTYEFIGLDNGYYIVEVGDTNGAPNTGNAAPYGGTQTAEPNDNQTVTAGSANGTNGVCAAGCNNNWGSTASTLNSGNLNLLNSPTAEEIIGGVNFGYNVPNAVLYGNIWWDVNGSTTQNAGETGLSGFSVQRWSDPNGDGDPADGVLQSTTTTDADGNYSFSGLAAGSYVIVVVPPTLLNNVWTETVESTGGTGSLDNRIPVTVAAGAISGSHNFAYTQSSTSEIGDTLYFDLDSDSLQDPGEDGIPSVTVWLYTDVDRDGTIDDGVDELYATDVTDASGNYLFSAVPAGSYVVKVDTDDPDFPTNVTATGDPDLVAASIGDFIWLDANGNGTFNAGEDGIPGVVVNLYSDSDGSGTFNGADELVESTITNINGNYLFTGLPAGGYFVDVDETTLPSASLAITTTDPATTLITLANSLSTTQVLTADAGYSLSSNFSIGNRLWHDVDNDGVQDAGESGIPFVDVVVTNGTGTGCAGGCRVTTDADGFWIVTGLTNGSFTVDVDNTDDDFPRDFTLTTGSTDPRVVNVAGADLTNVDFGYRYTGSGSSPTGTISGRVFLDGDGDLAYDVGEARSGTTVNLLDSGNNIVATTTTAADGTYSFAGAFIGQYSVESVDFLGTRYSTIFLAAAQNLSNINVLYHSTIENTADSQSSISVDGVHANLLQDFGYRRFLGTIGDSVYWDVNENGNQDIGEPGFPNVTVRLYDAVWTDSNGDGFFQAGEATTTLVDTTSTVADDPSTPANEGGTYLFQNLEALASGHYYLVIVDTTTLPGASQTLVADPDSDGVPCASLPLDGVPASVCDNNKLVLGFIDGSNFLGADFGYQVTGSSYATIGDQLWIDTDADGTKDSGESGIAFVTVWLDTDNDGVVDWADGNGNGVWDSGEGEQWTQSDSDGYYVFTGIGDGTYNLKVLTSDPDWPSGLSTTPTYEVRGGNTAGLNNAVQVVVSSGAVSSIVDGDPGTTDTCSSCNLSVDFGYRYAGTNTVSGTICIDDPTFNGYCGATALTYSGVDTGNEAALAGITVTAYRWVDDGDNNAWDGAGSIDSGDTFTLLGSASTDANGDYTFSNLPADVVFVFSVNDSQNLRLTTTNANSSVEDANVIKRQLYEGTSTYLGNTVTVLARQALNLGGDADDNVLDLDWALDGTLGGLVTYDFGDLPSGYLNTLLTNSGAQHLVTGGSIHLGSAVTTENDGRPSSTAALDGSDDGVTMVSTVFGTGEDGNGSIGYIDINASDAGWVAGWIDFNGDGDFNDQYELMLDQAVVAGTNSFYFYVPGVSVIPNGLTDFFARFRIYPSRPQMIASTGPAFDSSFARISGEVEDYLFVMGVSPTEVDMAQIDAVQNKKGVTLTWQTTSETDNLGFHVYRQSASGTPERLNRHIITGSAFMTGRRTNGPRSYRFVDRKAPEGFVQYFIEDVDLDGTKTMHGPVSPTSGPDEPETVITDPDPTVGSVGGIFTTAPGMGVEVPAPPAPSQAQLDEQWKLAGVQAVKVIVTQPGWYRVTKSQLLAAGYDPGNNGRAISVYTEGVEVPVFVNAKNAAQFGNDDSIEFFGRGIDTTSTGGRVYYITVKRGSGLRVKSVGGKGGSGSPAPNSFATSFSRIERTVFFTALTNNGDRENFFGPIVTSWPVTQSITVANLDASGNAKLELVLQGGSDKLEHVVEANLNGYSLPVIRFRNLERHVATLTVPASRLVNGENVLTLTALNGWEDVSVLESLKLEYKHTFRADGDALTFNVAGGTAVTVKGFTTDQIRVLDVTDPMAPDFINATIGNAGDGTKQVSFAAPTTGGSGARTIFAFAENRVLAPAQVAYNEPSTWNAENNGATLVIITNRAFLAAAEALRSARIAQGYATVVVDVQNLYDEFSYGHHSPQAIRDFLQRTRTWKTVPRYAILFGDASFDPRNYLGFGSYDFVPTKLVPTTYMKTASDDWFADFSGTGIPDIAIGRLPARTPEEANAMVAKLTARIGPPSGSWAQRVTIASDWANGYPFDAAADSIAASIPASYTKQRIPFATTPDPAGAVVSSFNDGSLLTTYIGHGSVEMWSSYVFGSWNASALTNADRLPFVVALNCLNGYYHDLFTESLAEALMKNPNGGAIGVWASSALSGAAGQVNVSLEFNRQAFGDTPVTVGDAILRAKQASPNLDVRRSWILFGDPTLRLK